MYIATIDCGTTNSRIYIVDENGNVVGKATRKVGVRDTAINGSNEVLKNGIKETYYQALADAGLKSDDMALVISSGMITSEIGLIEIPHLWAPSGMKDLADTILKVDDPNVVTIDRPIYFIRGIKNKYDADQFSIGQVGHLDFMRGEETQVAGLLSSYQINLPVTVVVLSSHTKFISIDKNANILGSLTTISGQTFEAISNQTFIGKSIRGDLASLDEIALDYEIVEHAHELVRQVGFLRALMMPRFLDVLLETKWYQRLLYVESVIASEDMRTIGFFDELKFPKETDFILIGDYRRCSIYEHLLNEKIPEVRDIRKIYTAQEIDSLSINGAIHLAKMAGYLKE